MLHLRLFSSRVHVVQKSDVHLRLIKYRLFTQNTNSGLHSEHHNDSYTLVILNYKTHLFSLLKKIKEMKMTQYKPHSTQTV